MRQTIDDGQHGSLGQVALFAGIALVAALATTLVPSWQAGRVAPAEALGCE